MPKNKGAFLSATAISDYHSNTSRCCCFTWQVCLHHHPRLKPLLLVLFCCLGAPHLWLTRKGRKEQVGWASPLRSRLITACMVWGSTVVVGSAA